MSSLRSNRCDYALKAMLELAKRAGTGPVRVAEIAQAQDVPGRFLEAIMNDLKNAGLVSSRRGVKGGYWLGRCAHEIRVVEVVRQIDGPSVAEREDEAVGADETGVGPSFAVRTLWAGAAEALDTFYARVTIGDLVEIDRRFTSSGAQNAR